MAEGKKNEFFALGKDVAKAGVFGVLFGLVSGTCPLVVSTTAMSMATMGRSMERVRGKRDFWNTAAVGGAGVLCSGIVGVAKPHVAIPLILGGSVFAGLTHVLLLEG